MKLKLLGLMAVAFFAVGIGVAHANFADGYPQAPPGNTDVITFTFETYNAGQGFGAVANLLTLQTINGSSTVEAGQVIPTSTGVPILIDGVSSQVKNSSQTYTAGYLLDHGFTANNLVVLLNLSEQGSLAPADLQFFSLDFYDSSGSLIGRTQTGNAPQYNIIPSGLGTGVDGWVMPYTNNGFLTTFFSNRDNVVGGTGYLTDVGDGQDNFVLATRAAPVPIPAAVWLLGSGMIGLIGIRRRIVAK